MDEIIGILLLRIGIRGQQGEAFMLMTACRQKKTV